MQTLVSNTQATQAEEPAIEGAILCSACGCVWVRNHLGQGRILGTLVRSGRRCSWRSAYASNR
jgi:hypothetical protein